MAVAISDLFIAIVPFLLCESSEKVIIALKISGLFQKSLCVLLT